MSADRPPTSATPGERLAIALRQLEAAQVRISEVVALEDQINDARAAGPLALREFFVCRRGFRNLAIYVQIEELNGRAYVIGYRLEGFPRIFDSFLEAEAEAENVEIPAEIRTPGEDKKIREFDALGARTVQTVGPHEEEQGEGVSL